MAIVILTDVGDPSSTGRLASMLITAKVFKEEGDDVVASFDGAGARWMLELARRRAKVQSPTQIPGRPRCRGVREGIDAAE